MKILITGGTGFIGSHAGIRLKQLGHQVTLLGRNEKLGRSLEQQGLEFRKVDLVERPALLESMQGSDVVLHCGGLASPIGKYESFYQVNVVGTQNVIDACFEHGIERLIYLSTPSLYFNYDHRLNIKESDPLPARQVTFYGATKLLADEKIQLAHARGLKTISLRPRGVFGPGDQNVAGRMAKAIERGWVPLVDGGSSLVDLTYIDNCVDAIALCLNAPIGKSAKFYNITNGEPTSTKEILQILQEELHEKARLIPLPFSVVHTLAAFLEKAYSLLGMKKEPPLTKYAVGLMAKSQTLDITRAKTDLNYQPKVTLREGFKRFASWWTMKPAREALTFPPEFSAEKI